MNCDCLDSYRSQLVFLLLLALSACGGGGGAETAPGTVRTLAYASSYCREDATQLTARQELRIQRGEGATVTVPDTADTFTQSPPILPGGCRAYGMVRGAFFAVESGGIQRLGVSPDGRRSCSREPIGSRFSRGRRCPRSAKDSSWCVLTAAACGAWVRRVGTRYFDACWTRRIRFSPRVLLRKIPYTLAPTVDGSYFRIEDQTQQAKTPSNSC